MRGSAGSSGDSWRWNLSRQRYTTSSPTIQVIEPPADEEDSRPAKKSRLPFGFGIREQDPEIICVRALCVLPAGHPGDCSVAQGWPAIEDWLP